MFFDQYAHIKKYSEIRSQTPKFGEKWDKSYIFWCILFIAFQRALVEPSILFQTQIILIFVIFCQYAHIRKFGPRPPNFLFLKKYYISCKVMIICYQGALNHYHSFIFCQIMIKRLKFHDFSPLKNLLPILRIYKIESYFNQGIYIQWEDDITNFLPVCWIIYPYILHTTCIHIFTNWDFVLIVWT